MKTALVIPVEGNPREVLIPEGAGDELNALQQLVGGWIEYVPTEQEVTLYCNEEGKLEGLAANRLATSVFGKYLQPTDYLAGDIVILGPMDEEGETTSIGAHWVDYFSAERVA